MSTDPRTLSNVYRDGHLHKRGKCVKRNDGSRYTGDTNVRQVASLSLTNDARLLRITYRERVGDAQRSSVVEIVLQVHFW